MRKILILFIIISSHSFGQDIHFTQFWNAPIQINPAQTGLIDGKMRFGLMHRSQWASINAPFNTYSFNGDYRIETSKSVSIGIGLNLFRDVSGDLKFGTTNAQLSVSSLLKVSDKSTIGVGIIGGMIQKSFSQSNMMWGSQYQGGTYVPTAGSGETINYNPGTKADFSAGLVYRYGTKNTIMTSNDKITGVIGVSYNHINKVKTNWTSYNTDILYSNLIVHGNLNVGIGSTRLTAIPGFLVMLQGPSKEISAGMLFKYQIKEPSKVTGNVKQANVYAGAYTRIGDAVMPTIQMEYDKYMVGLSYDLNVSGLKAASSMRGGFEICLRYLPGNSKGSVASFN